MILDKRAKIIEISLSFLRECEYGLKSTAPTDIFEKRLPRKYLSRGCSLTIEFVNILKA